MTHIAEHQAANILPPRRGAVLAIAVDTTARAYDITTIDLGDVYKAAHGDEVYLTLQADGAKVYYHFKETTGGTGLDNTAAVAAGGTIAFADTYGAFVGDGERVQERITRNLDKFLVVKTASGTATLRIWASSHSTGTMP